MGNKPNNSSNLGNVDIELTKNLECENFIQQEDNLKLVESFKNNLWKRAVYISGVLLAVMIAVLVVFFAGYFVRYNVEQSNEGNDHSKMVNQTSTVCLEDLQISFADYLGNDPILDCIYYSRNFTVKKCAKLCRKGGHIYECQSQGDTNIIIIRAENIICCNDGNPKYYDVKIANDVSCICEPLDYKKLGIYDAGDL